MHYQLWIFNPSDNLPTGDWEGDDEDLDPSLLI